MASQIRDDAHELANLIDTRAQGIEEHVNQALIRIGDSHFTVTNVIHILRQCAEWHKELTEVFTRASEVMRSPSFQVIIDTLQGDPEYDPNAFLEWIKRDDRESPIIEIENLSRSLHPAFSHWHESMIGLISKVRLKVENNRPRLRIPPGMRTAVKLVYEEFTLLKALYDEEVEEVQGSFVLATDAGNVLLEKRRSQRRIDYKLEQIRRFNETPFRKIENDMQSLDALVNKAVNKFRVFNYPGFDLHSLRGRIRSEQKRLSGHLCMAQSQAERIRLACSKLSLLEENVNNVTEIIIQYQEILSTYESMAVRS